MAWRIKRLSKGQSYGHKIVDHRISVYSEPVYVVTCVIQPHIIMYMYSGPKISAIFLIMWEGGGGGESERRKKSDQEGGEWEEESIVGGGGRKGGWEECEGKGRA